MAIQKRCLIRLTIILCSIWGIISLGLVLLPWTTEYKTPQIKHSTLNEINLENNTIDIDTPNSAIANPNILLLLPDQWRFDWFVNSDFLDIPTMRSIQSNGVWFQNTVVGSPTCVPSRCTLAAGMEYHELEIWGNNFNFPDNIITFYKLLQDNNYWTMTAGKDDLTKVHGVDVNGKYRENDLGFSDSARCLGKLDLNHKYPNIVDPYSMYLSNQYEIHNGVNKSHYEIINECYKSCNTIQDCSIPCEISKYSNISYQDNWITYKSLQLLDNAVTQNKSWFLQVNFAGPHVPYMITKRIKDIFTKTDKSYPLPIKYKEINTTNRKNVDRSREQYAATIENLDEQFKIIINKLKDLNEYDKTVICVSSDHGDILGDMDDFGKFQPWVQATNVPLICSGPGIIKNRIIKTQIEFIDLSATFLELTNSNKSNSMTTVSLKPFLNGIWNDNNNMYRDYIISGYNPWKLIIKTIDEIVWKYICCSPKEKCGNQRFKYYSYHNGSNINLLFDITNDLYELNNVANENPDIVKTMNKLLPIPCH
eukprot:54887_1